MKSYLRYEPSKVLGLITSSKCTAIYDWSGNLALSGCADTIAVWNVRQATQISCLRSDNPNYPFAYLGDVTCLAAGNDKRTVVAGYSTGEIVVYNMINSTIIAVFRGHRGVVRDVKIDSQSTILVSGGDDCQCFLWDLVTLTCKSTLIGHKDAITSCNFVYHETTTSPIYVITSSKDSLLKVWDMTTYSCVQTIVGHRCEIWTCVVVQIQNDKNILNLILTGCADEYLRGYIETEDPQINSISQEVFKPYGQIKLASNCCSCMAFTMKGSLLFTLSGTSGRDLAIFKVRDWLDTKKKHKRRLKNGKRPDVEPTEMIHSVENNSMEISLCDRLVTYCSYKFAHKIKGISLNAGKLEDKTLRMITTNSNNTLEVYNIFDGSDDHILKLSCLEMSGHRSDVRAVSISHEGLYFASSSSDGTKLWNSQSNLPVRYCLTGQGVSLCFVPGDKYLLIATKEGRIQIMDVSTGELCVDAEAHSPDTAWAVTATSDGKGFITGGSDKFVKFWEFKVTQGKLGIAMWRQIQLSHEVLTLKISSGNDMKKPLLAVGLLDNTVKVFYADTGKFYLSLYGHKLPVLAVDISYDNSILISGGGDKTVKIWGLDFGDCHKSLLGHEDSITAVKFIPNTHYFFSASKDGNIKYWDADRFEQILHLPGHNGAIWGVDISTDGSFAVSCGLDRSLRIWQRTDDLVFVEEEKERALESLADNALIQNQEKQIDRSDIAAPNSVQVDAHVRPNVDSLKGSERLIDAIELVKNEVNNMMEREDVGVNNPLLLGMTPLTYISWTLKDLIKSSDLELSLVMLPFHLAWSLLDLLLLMAAGGLEPELCASCAVCLLRNHQNRILAADDANIHHCLMELKRFLRSLIDKDRTLIGINLAALKYLQRSSDSKRNIVVGNDIALLDNKRVKLNL